MIVSHTYLVPGSVYDMAPQGSCIVSPFLSLEVVTRENMSTRWTMSSTFKSASQAVLSLDATNICLVGEKPNLIRPGIVVMQRVYDHTRLRPCTMLSKYALPPRRGISCISWVSCSPDGSLLHNFYFTLLSYKLFIQGDLVY